MTTESLDRLERLFTEQGAAAYLGEPVTVAHHMLQCATLATSEGAPDALVAAALLHDIGHLTSSLGTYAPDDMTDRRHQDAGATTLRDMHFPPVIVESVRLHVAAKRYLCAVDKSYAGRLSPASQHSLILQGGPMDPAEVQAFERNPFHWEATQVRLWDDGGKDAARTTPAFRDFRPLLSALLSAAPDEKDGPDVR